MKIEIRGYRPGQAAAYRCVEPPCTGGFVEASGHVLLDARSHAETVHGDPAPLMVKVRAEEPQEDSIGLVGFDEETYDAWFGS